VRKRPRKAVVYIATSADEYIARSDGDVGWLERKSAAGNYGLKRFLRSIDTIVWGRTTYEFALRHGGLAIFGKSIRNYVFTARGGVPPQMDVEFVNEPVAEFVQRLCSKSGKNIWLMGGARIIASFLDEGMVDQFMIHVIPVLIGEGIPLASPRPRTVPLILESTRTYADGVIRLSYRTGADGQAHGVR
jgi:dihydrofolate reductase